MRDHLITYLNDHLSGARFAVDLLEHIRDQHSAEPLGEFAAEMLHEIESDRKELEELLNELGGSKHRLKEFAAFLTEKVSHLKFRLGGGDQLALLEAFETLSLGVLGKLKLWIVLSKIAPHHPKLQKLDLRRLLARAQEQHDAIEKHRLIIAPKALSD
jgi:hypothetical protein